MRLSKRLSIAAGTVATAAAMAAGVTPAMAAWQPFPDQSTCPRTAPGVTACLQIQSRSGHLTIKGFTVPIGESLQIRGGLIPHADGTADFVPPTGTTGVFARDIQVPGGILGIDLPISLNKVTARATLAGSPSDVRIRPAELEVAMPIKLELSNPLIGPSCRIGTDANPVRVLLTVGTTNPPAPNRPISGSHGELSLLSDGSLGFLGNVNVDNSFSIPGASYCGLGLGLINTVLNAKLKLPSAGGNNEMVIGNDVALGGA
jgi:hypothetical protein